MFLHRGLVNLYHEHRWAGKLRVRNVERALEVDRVPKVQNLCIYLSIYLSIYIRKQIYI